ncbi:conserved hypothetical protein [Chthoniobacter flavus Ellin428]|uniref:DUF3500 domain-containing protein n=1 Tax=Chthoniobacter flavus Ellin428 TaxID=497964 RepID=B4D334_9BACT|nr:DUF3500 domain-containing protein [Chthoniobacter flavus]EDY19145.1 conserved hypothetical protein [Chthoniobacter flavus Ellin428]TCO87992.1 uncharacterized protein DUF3500 [Chthoniobacter flavus]
MKLRHLLPLALCGLFAAPLHAHDADAEMTAAAINFLSSLTPEQKARVTFDFPNDERKNWHYIPRERKGLPIKDMAPEQRLLAQALLASGLSSRGYEKAVSIMSLDAVLKELEKGKTGPVRDPDNYYFSIFGTPGGKDPWGWRFEGHHLSLNYTEVGDGDPAMTPSFFGSNPGEVKTGPRAGTRILAAEEDLGRALVKSLTDEQRKVAVLQVAAPKDILNDPKRIDPTNPEGISQSQLTPEQTATLVKLIKEYIFRCRPDVAADDWAKIEKAGLDKLHFAWAGGLERGQPHYYRVQGGHFVLEYDNTQNDANHVHSVWRDFDHDFGLDLLKEHIQADHTAK